VTEPITERPPLRGGIVGCGRVGHKRAAALGEDTLVAGFDADPGATRSLVDSFGGLACASLGELLGQDLDVVVVALPHDRLAEHACRALEASAHVLVVNPAGI
jgi:predicted dehydrogenase